MQYTFQNDVSRFVANIIPLQNIQSNAGGTTDVGTLTTAVAELQSMVDFTQKRINTNFMSAYDTGATIQVLSPMNMSNGSLTIGGDIVSAGGNGSGGSSISTIAAGTTSISLFNTNIQMDVGGVSTLTLNSSGNATFSGDVYAQQFITLSDMSFKTNIRSFERPVLEGVLKLEPKIFQYAVGAAAVSSTDEIGFLAQEVEAIFPECVKESSGKKYINFQALTVLLLKAVKELAVRRLN